MPLSVPVPSAADAAPVAMLTEPVTGPSAWLARDFTGEDDWVAVLTAEEVRELDEAVAALRDHERPLAELTLADFPLPTLAKSLEQAVQDLEFGRGFTVLRGLPVERWSLEEARLAYWGIALHLGTPVSQNASGELIAHVRDYGEGGLDLPTTRAYRTRNALPFHTDSSDIVGLLCLRSAGQGGGVSTLASSMTVYNHLLAHHRELLGLFYRGFVYDRRTEEGSQELPYYRNAVYGWFDGQLSCRFYMTHYIESAVAHTGIPLSDVERYALRLFQDIAARDEHRVEMTLRPGDLQLLNNNVLVHGRSAYEDEPGRRRDLLRLWLNTRSARRIPDHFARFRHGMPTTRRA
ncbi:TauD/TfdA family dioxygenase [Streptomyces sp. UNOC14_S4]|uniref:TauD/TfdA family dioxygenase n=1 Tax=Streptomyces sp. UNOC14_S4 TaxID=2872340 RepID=UPI001E3D9427|nr:TauD/TfdA family dioxygenase [Streptomyces sp. UNOC14_S4]MCC3768356.1 TauD/TfdA family dioxygenase [Streptomyces sp. UNOC14_S4]